ncbi:hypothetical protein B566_EDAN007115 [Ephemera danica]|nr:hypothetical protein B566_EDAN007115 [Ephemera danica]
MEGEPVYVRVLYNFDYTAKETKLVSIRQGEKLELLKQTNSDWWQVRRDDETKPFYVPAAYVREIPPAFINPALIHAGPKGFNSKNVKIIPKHDISPKFSPSADYQNIGAPDSSPESPRNNIENTLRKELIHGNFNSPKPCDNNKNKFIDNKLQDSTRLGNLVNDIKVQQKVSPDNRGVVSFQPSSKAVETRSYSVVTPVIAKKPPVPCPRLKELSKSLETLAEEIQFTPSSQQQSDSSWKNGETSDYHTPSPDNLENDTMFGWRKSIQPKIPDDPSGSSNVQRSSSFRITRWPSRKKKRERKRAEIKENEECSEEDSTVSRSLESLVDSGAEACSSSSYEWDRSGETSEGATTPKRIPEPLAFRNFTYRSSDSDEEEAPRQRSVSDTSQPDSQPLNPNLVSSKSESQVQDEQPRPLVSLKRNQKLVSKCCMVN